MTPLPLMLAVKVLPVDTRDEILRELLEKHAQIRSSRGQPIMISPPAREAAR